MLPLFNIREYREGDLENILGIFNYFALHSFAVYSETPLTADQLRKVLAESRALLVIEIDKQVVGFGAINHYKPFPNFNHTGVLAYFIKEEFTGKGLGKKLLHALFGKGRELGITNYVAHISSMNQTSLEFHKHMGFTEVGRLKAISRKFGEPVDVVWVQMTTD